MVARSVRPLKLTPPALAGVHPRTRLFRRLDALRACPVIWIAAPAGAGKTTLVASYLDSHGICPLWYRLDAGDADPATFFHYLGEGLRYRNRSRKPPLPRLGPDGTDALAAFTRRFFRALFARLGTPGALVLDNLEDVQDARPFLEILAQGIEEIPPGCQVLVTSRGEPPPVLARALATGRIARLDWHDLQLTPDESLAIARLLVPESALPEELATRLHETAGGWITGLLLQLESVGGPHDPPPDDELPAHRFDAYFDGEIFSRLPPPRRRLLLRTAWLAPVRPGDAGRLAGLRNAGRHLAALAQRHMFVTRLEGGRPAYAYHPLLRAFLQRRARAELAPDALRALQRETARLLAAAGETDAAARLFRETGDWPALESLIREHAPRLLAEGRHRRLEEWLEALPETRLDADPWLRLWAGNALLVHAPERAGAHFRAAWERFLEAGDPRGLHSAWLGIMDSLMYANDSLADVPRWLDALERAQARCGPPPDPALAGRVALTAFNMGFTACPGSRPAADWKTAAEELRQRLPAIPDDTARCLAAACLAMFFTWHPQPARLNLLADDLLPLAENARVAPLARVFACLVEITRRWNTGQTDDADAFVDRALALAEDHGITVARLWLLSAATIHALTREAAGRADALLRQYRRHMRPANRHEQVHYHYLAGWLAWQRGEPELAREHTARACADIRELHTPHFELLARCAHAYLLIEAGRGAEAAELIADTRRLAVACHSRSVSEYCLGLLEAWQACRENRPEDAAGHLRSALACGRELELQVVLWHLPPMLARLCAIALEHGIETEWVRRLIRRNRLRRPPGAALLERWPCRLRIHTLGRFGVECDGQPLDTAGRGHRKPLRLLKVLLALGARGLPAARVEDILWPEAEGNDARRALITTLQRLRRLLGGNDLLRFDDGRLTLHGGEAWVDTWALETGLRADDPARLDRALRLYRGPFLAEEGDPPWLLATRHRLHDDVLQGYARLGRHLAELANWDALIELALRGLKIDDLHEPFYRDLIRAHAHLGRHAEARRIYHRCEQRLQAELGTPPSPATRALIDALSP